METDVIDESFIDSLSNFDIKNVGYELIFGKIYDCIGFYAIIR